MKTYAYVDIIYRRFKSEKVVDLGKVNGDSSLNVKRGLLASNTSHIYIYYKYILIYIYG